MPVYEYACDKCGHEFEAEQRISDDPIRTCPKCRARKVKRLISRTSFVLKGGGWYSDLYASPGAKKSDDKADKADAKPDKSSGAEAGADKPAKSDAKSETKKDAKPAAKAKQKPKAA